MGIIISLPISLLLLWLVLKPKKDDSFPKGGLWRLLIAGAISTILSAILSQVLSLSLAAIRIGPGTFFDAIQTFRSDPAKGNELMANLSANKVPSPLWRIFCWSPGWGPGPSRRSSPRATAAGKPQGERKILQWRYF